MKYQKSEVTVAKLKKRLALSVAGMVFLFGGAWLLFSMIRNGEYIEEAPKLLRHSYMWNEKVWSMLSSSKRLSVNRPNPPAGTKPRVNGDIGLQTPPDLTDYRILVNNGETKLELSITDLKLLPRTSYSTEFRCIEGWSEDMQYSGVRFSDFLKEYKLGKKPDGTYYDYVGLVTPDKEYYVSIDMESMLHEQTVIAFEMNQSPLSISNGAPLRLIIPVKYGIKSLKRIGRIFFSDVRPPDYWAERGYDWYSGL